MKKSGTKRINMDNHLRLLIEFENCRRGKYTSDELRFVKRNGVGEMECFVEWVHESSGLFSLL